MITFRFITFVVCSMLYSRRVDWFICQGYALTINNFKTIFLAAYNNIQVMTHDLVFTNWTLSTVLYPATVSRF